MTANLGFRHRASFADEVDASQGIGVRIGRELPTKTGATATEDLAAHTAVSASVPGYGNGEGKVGW